MLEIKEICTCNINVIQKSIDNKKCIDIINENSEMKQKIIINRKRIQKHVTNL